MPLPGKDHNDSSYQTLTRYAGMAFQFLAAIGLMVWAGYRLDGFLKWSLPLWVWVLPLIAIIGMILGVMRNSSKK